MYRLRLLQYLKPYDWLAIAGALAVAVALYLILIHPAAASLAEMPKLESARAAASSNLDVLRQKVQATAIELTASKQKLEQLGGSPPSASQKDLQIARITALADQCGVRINQYVPVQTLDAQDHRAVIVEFAGQGGFVNIHRLFGKLESTVDFVDVTHFTIESLNSNGGSDCAIIWSCRINTLKPLSPEAPVSAASGASPRPASPSGGGT